TSADYYSLALQVVQSPNYAPVNEIVADGDIRISLKASGGSEGKAPSYWITARSNIYMTMQYLYLKKQGAFLSL
ncbi:MAG: hypothetical protein J5716_00700, partial [Alphaproteobacteria bacterium]|nr:hypothetical protein [Alphaproteobacteria bacterium]